MVSRAAPTPLEQRVDWLALGFCVPEEWEIVRHSVSFERGSLVFVDRVRQRLSVSWTVCARPPDLERLLSDFANQPLTVGETISEHTEIRGFHVLDCETRAGEHLSRALYFDSLSSRLIELETGPDSAGAAPVPMRELLASFSFSEREQGQCVRAFGVNAELPSGFTLRASNVKPADVILDFERPALRGEHLPDRLRIRRSGMARTWFDGDLARSVRLRNPELRLDELLPVAVGPHSALTARAAPRGAVLQRVLGRLATRQIAIWDCPASNAVFEIDASVPRGREPNAAGLSVQCCTAHRREPAHEG